MTKNLSAAVIGASGYTGADLIRLLLCHPSVDLQCLVAGRKAGQAMSSVFPHFRGHSLPILQALEDIEWAASCFDVVFCALPHGTSQRVIAQIMADAPEQTRVIDISADFRLRDPKLYEAWYGQPHAAEALQGEAVYGLTEWYREEIKQARLVACPGCYPTAVLLALIPLLRAGAVHADGLTIDAKSGVTGAGRALKENLLFAEVSEAIHPYGLGSHRHMPEMEQELALAANLTDLRISFTPHLVPMNRGELVTIYAHLADGQTLDDARAALQKAYADALFVDLLAEGDVPATRMVRGSNRVAINVFQDRIPDRLIIVAAIDNLVKGSSGQAIQNMNIMTGRPEAEGLGQVALFP